MTERKRQESLHKEDLSNMTLACHRGKGLGNTDWLCIQKQGPPVCPMRLICNLQFAWWQLQSHQQGRTCFYPFSRKDQWRDRRSWHNTMGQISLVLPIKVIFGTFMHESIQNRWDDQRRSTHTYKSRSGVWCQSWGAKQMLPLVQQKQNMQMKIWNVGITRGVSPAENWPNLHSFLLSHLFWLDGTLGSSQSCSSAQKGPAYPALQLLGAWLNIRGISRGEWVGHVPLGCKNNRCHFAKCSLLPYYATPTPTPGSCYSSPLSKKHSG